MTQVIQIKRKFTGAGTPATLAPGELAFNSTGNKLVIGGTLNTILPLVGAERQVEMTGDQLNIAGAKSIATGAGNSLTVPVAGLKVPGGTAGQVLSAVDAAGNMIYTSMVSSVQQFVGSLDAAAGTYDFTTASNIPGPGLPAAATTNNGWYVICDVAGAVAPGAPVGQYQIGDWLISNGVAWTHLEFGGIDSVTAADVGVVAPVTGGNNVQDVLESLEAADATFVVGPLASVADNIATYSDLLGHTIKDGGTKISDLATNTVVNNKITKPASVAAALNIAVYSDTTGGIAADGGELIASLNAKIDLKQDIATATAGDVVGPAAAINSNLAAFDTTTGKLIKDSLIATANVGDVKGQATAIAAADNIAVYSGTNQKAIKDGGVALAALALKTDITTAQADDVKIAGSTMTGVLILSETPAAADPVLQAATKGYVDTAISAIPAAPPLVKAPELTGDGQSVATAITFTGITTDTAVGPGAFAAAFSGNGLSTSALTLVCVDGGEYA